MTRYDRQELIEGWNQQLLDESKVLLVGDGLLSELTLFGLSAMGFGDIEYFNPKSESRFNNVTGKSVAELAKKMNQDVEILGIQLDISRNSSLFGEYDLAIDATNDPGSKLVLREYCQDKNVPMLSTSSTTHVGGVGLILPDSEEQLKENLLFLENAHAEQGVETSGVMAGITVEEARKLVAIFPEEKLLEDLVLYSPFEQPYFERHAITGRDVSLKDKKIAMIGAGGLGTPCGTALVLNDVGRLDIYDMDTIEENNLNRQFWYFGRVDEKKAPVLADRLRSFAGTSQVDGYDLKVSLENADRFADYDLMIDCLDSFKTRALLNYISREHSIPLISGGSSYQAGQVITCKGACLDCQFDIHKKALQSREAESCLDAPTPSVITSNLVIGFMQAAQCKNLGTEQPLLKYVSGEEYRLGDFASKQECSCTPNQLKKFVEGLYNG